MKHNIIRAAIFAAAIFAAAIFSLPACKSPDPQANSRAAKQALSEAGKVLGDFGTQTLFNVAQQEANGGKVDLASAAAAGLWQSVGTAVTGGAVSRIVSAYSNNALPQTASAAATVAGAAIESGQPPDKIAAALAAVISTAAGAPPGK